MWTQCEGVVAFMDSTECYVYVVLMCARTAIMEIMPPKGMKEA